MRLMRMFVVLACIFPLAGLAFAAGEHGATKHYEDSVLKMTDRGTFSVEMLLHGHALQMGLNEFDIIIHDATDRDVPGAKLTITPWMPSMGHGVLEKPEITDRGPATDERQEEQHPAGHPGRRQEDARGGGGDIRHQEDRRRHLRGDL